MMRNIKEVYFIGSGFSRSVDGPSWEDLKKFLIWETIGYYKGANFEEYWEELVRKFLKKYSHIKQSKEIIEKPEFVTFLISKYYGGKRGLKSFFSRYLLQYPSVLHIVVIQELMKRKAILLTTEFDGLFRKTLDLLNIKYTKKFYGKKTDKKVEVFRIGNSLKIVELHGNIVDEETLICELDEIEEWKNDEIVDFLNDELNTKKILFIFWGYSGRDSDIKDLFRKLEISSSKILKTFVIRRSGNSIGELDEIFRDRIHISPNERKPIKTWEKLKKECNKLCVKK